MATPREERFDKMADNVSYVVSPEFKRDTLNGTSAMERQAQKALADRIAGAVMNRDVEWFGFDGKKQAAGKRNKTSLGAFLGWIDSGLNTLLSATKANSKQLEAISRKLDALAADVAAHSAQGPESLGTYELKKVV